jgi:peptide/nickel transport system substrate-binding protein
MKTLAIIILGLLLAGTLGATGQPEEQILNFALSGNPDTLDPQKTSGTLTFQTCKSIYDTLVEPDQDAKIIPALAESYDISADGLTWTFNLRKGVTFHNGDPFTSADVKASIERIKSEETGSPNANEFAVIQSIATPDDHTVVFSLEKPSAPLLSTLASGWGAILPKSLIDSGHDFASQPVGTGPYRITEYIRDAKIVLEKNEDYWMKGHPKLDKIVMNVIPERAVQVQGLIAGHVDISYVTVPEDLPILEDSGQVTIEYYNSALVQVLSMNCSRPPLDDIRVRQAINHAVDKETVMEVAYGGGDVVGTFLYPGSAFYKDFTKLYTYDPEKAKSLLAQAGVGSDVELEMSLPQNYPPHVNAGQMYVEMLSKVGLNVKIKLVDWSTWISDVYRGAKYDLTVIGHTGKLDPHGTLANYGRETRYVRWINEEFAQLVDKAAVTVDFEPRQKLYHEALEIIAREVPFVFVGAPQRRIVFRNEVTGFRLTPNLDTFDFRWTEVNR